MSSLKVSQIRDKLRTMFEPHLDVADIGANDKERDQKILSRCLAAFAIYLKAGCSESEAAESVWDGADDNGIDAAFFDASDKRVIFVQSKWINKGSGEPEAKDVGVFLKGVWDAVEQDPTAFHNRLQTKFRDISSRLSTPGTSVEMVLVTTGASALGSHSKKLLSDCVHELNDGDPNGIAESSVLGLSDVYDGLANDLSQSNVEVDATILDWSYIATPYPAYFGIIDGLSLKSWWVRHGKRIVSANIRHSLGTTEVNNEIKNTAAIAPQKFWYFNNGITLIANETTKAPAKAGSRAAGIFTFKGASIVNGAQTVSSLARVTEDEQLGLVRVPIRVILLQDAPSGFGNEVTRTNNLQNKVEPRDFVAQDAEQKRIRTEMAIEGIDYQFVRSDESVPSLTTCELLEVTTALACATGDPTHAVLVKTGIGRFFLDLTKAPYRTLFNPGTSGAKAFNATLLLRQVDRWIEAKKVLVAKNGRSGPPWGCLVHGNRILAAAVFGRFGVSQLSQPITKFKELLNESEIDRHCEHIYTGMVESVKRDYAGKFLATLFKNPTMSKAVFDASQR